MRVLTSYNKTMHVTPLSYKIGACQIFVKNFSSKKKKILNLVWCNPDLSVFQMCDNMSRAVCQNYRANKIH